MSTEPLVPLMQMPPTPEGFRCSCEVCGRTTSVTASTVCLCVGLANSGVLTFTDGLVIPDGFMNATPEQLRTLATQDLPVSVHAQDELRRRGEEA